MGSQPNAVATWGADVAMLLALVVTSCRMSRIACLGSLSVRLSVILLVLSVIRDDWMLGLVAVISMISGDAGLVLLARWAGDKP